MTRRLIVAITGATGAAFGVRTLERLREFDGKALRSITQAGDALAKHAPRRRRRASRPISRSC